MTTHDNGDVGWLEVGVVAVDSGHLWLGDPCHVLDPSRKRPRELGTSWADMTNRIIASDTQQWLFDAGTPGLAVTVAAGHGDGHYPVWVRRTPAGDIAAVMIQFIPDDDADR
jgi:hypothetical protein